MHMPMSAGAPRLLFASFLLIASGLTMPVAQADDPCPGWPDCTTGSATLYLGRGPEGTASGNVDVLVGATGLVAGLRMDPSSPGSSDPAVILAPGVDGTEAHNLFYEPAEWASIAPVALDGADIEVVWWGLQPGTGFAFFEQWDVQLYFDGAATPVAEALNLEFTGLTDGIIPTEYRATFPDVSGSGILSVVIDPSSFANQQDFFI